MTEMLLHRVSEGAPAFAAAFRRFATLTVAEYLDRLVVRPPADRGVAEVADVVRTLAAPVYGAELADRAATEMTDDPVVTTSNHCGLDTMADAFHGTLLHALRGRRRLPDRHTAVVLGAGTVSLDNSTFGMGLLSYEPGRGLCSTSRRLPLLPRKQRRAVIRAARRLTRDDVARALTRLDADSGSSGGVSDRGRAELRRTLEEDVGIAEVLDAPSYDHQCRLINARLWDRSVPDTCPRPVYVEDEQVAAVLLSRDLHDTHSLIYPLIFDPDIRAQLVRALDGVPTCWRTSLLENGDQRGGSHLFWALSPKGHRVPVVLRPGCGSDRLVEMSAGGDSRSWDVSPEPLTEAVAEGELLPTAPLSFMAVSFARGIACVGGFYQFDYLPRIYAAVRTTLDQWGLRSRLAEVPTDYYLAGIQPILARDPSGSCIPLGPVALAADGPLTEDEIGAMLRMAMGEAQTAAMAEILGELLAVREVARSDARLLDEALTAARTVVIRELAP